MKGDKKDWLLNRDELNAKIDELAEEQRRNPRPTTPEMEADLKRLEPPYDGHGRICLTFMVND